MSHPDLHIRLIAFMYDIPVGKPKDIGWEAHAWASPVELSGYDLLPSDRELAAILFKTLSYFPVAARAVTSV